MSALKNLTLSMLLLFCSTTFSQPTPTADEVYKDAIKSLTAGDCASALRHLANYKLIAAATLQSNPEFSAQLEAQRQLCVKRVAERKFNPAISGEKPGIRGMESANNKTIELRTR